MGVAVTDAGRRQFLRGDIGLRRLPVRPPWALTEAHFSASCTRCGHCLPACDKGLIRIGDGGYPCIDFNNGGCTFCGDCAQACTPGALLKNEQSRAAPWSLQVRVSEQCLAVNAVVCRTCAEQCDARAIRFQLAIGGRAQPHIDHDLCTGCGDCVAPCPVQALSIEQQHYE